MESDTLDVVKKYAISCLRVFITTVGTLLVATGGSISWTWTFWYPLLAAGMSAVLKSIIDPQVPERLGGTKQY